MTNFAGNLDAYLSDPKNFLHAANVQNQTFDFFSTSREELSSLPFLDTRARDQKYDFTQVAAGEVFAALEKYNFRAGPPRANFIFHTSFCCSTLISRCLDRPGKNLSLKEPFVLLGLSAFKRMTANFTGREPGWVNLRDITLFLMTRRFAGEEKILIKPSNGANNIMPEILAAPQTDKVLFLFDNLEGFLVSVLSGGKGRADFIHDMLKLVLIDYQGLVPARAPLPGTLDTLQKAALVWGLQMKFFAKALKTATPGKVKSLESPRFLKNPGDALEKLGDFFSLGLDPGNIAGILDSPAFTAYSKDQEPAFSTRQRGKKKARTAGIFDHEISRTLSWANDLGLLFEGGLAQRL